MASYGSVSTIGVFLLKEEENSTVVSSRLVDSGSESASKGLGSATTSTTRKYIIIITLFIQRGDIPGGHGLLLCGRDHARTGALAQTGETRSDTGTGSRGLRGLEG